MVPRNVHLRGHGHYPDPLLVPVQQLLFPCAACQLRPCPSHSGSRDCINLGLFGSLDNRRGLQCSVESKCPPLLLHSFGIFWGAGSFPIIPPHVPPCYTSSPCLQRPCTFAHFVVFGCWVPTDKEVCIVTACPSRTSWLGGRRCAPTACCRCDSCLTDVHLSSTRPVQAMDGKRCSPVLAPRVLLNNSASPGGGGANPPPSDRISWWEKMKILQKETLIWLCLVHKLLDYWVPGPPQPPPPPLLRRTLLAPAMLTSPHPRGSYIGHMVPVCGRKCEIGRTETRAANTLCTQPSFAASLPLGK